MEYAVLVSPSANRVYSRSAVDLTRAELAVFASCALDAEVHDLRTVTLGNVVHVGFTATDALTDRDLARLSNLSSAFALYQRVDDELLRPLPMTPRRRHPDDLLTIQRYAGKTNEHFTKLLVNLAVLAGPRPDALVEGKLDLLDPLCGRGTTLNHGLVSGFDVTGIDVDGNDVDAYSSFLRTWMRDHRYKHEADTHPVRRDKVTLGRRFDATLATDKQAFKAGDVDRVSVVAADTRQARSFLRRESFDVLATDAPYGVQHGSRGGDRLSRRPDEMLEEALPVWHELLRPAGSLALSWNTRVDPRDAMVDRLTRHGFVVVDPPWADAFCHRVDHAIERDVVVARRTA